MKETLIKCLKLYCKEKMKKRVASKDAQSPTMPTQENLKIKKYYTNECPNVKKKKFKSNIVGADASAPPARSK